MALATHPDRYGPSSAVRRGRGATVRLVLTAEQALAAPLEGQAMASEVVAHVNRLLLANAAGARQTVHSEASRLGRLAVAYRTEFARLAAELEPGNGDEAA